uniref:Tudor domain-containing protein 7B n=1 Tax=Denticeps clupeoides TaxID=299321 RepID=A0AAY4A2Q1_9TELE
MPPFREPKMTDAELVKKMLRAVLQPSKSGVPLSRLQAQYKEVTGELIPFKQMGHPTLDALLQSMPHVVQLERSRGGEVLCFATGVGEMAHVAKLVARQRTAKKTGRPQLVNCQMRVKPVAPLMLNAKPRTSLRQPDHQGRLGRGGSRQGGHGDGRQGYVRDNQSDSRNTAQDKPPNTPTRKTTNPNESTPLGKPKASNTGYNPQLVQSRLKEVLNKHSHGFWVSKLPQLYRELYKQELPNEALKDLEQWTHLCTVSYCLKPDFPSSHDLSHPCSPSTVITPKQEMQSPVLHKPHKPKTAIPSPPDSPSSLSPELKHKLGELLLKYSSGLWAHALPKLYQDTYKAKLPEHVLENLSLLSDICTVDYPMPDNPKRAILYMRAGEDENCNPAPFRDLQARAEAGKRLSSQLVPPLLIPSEEYPSVLVVEAASTDSVILRYIGEGYSKAQEKMEDEMREFYRQDNTRHVLSSPAAGQLAAVHAEEEEEILRAQVCEVMTDKSKVYYVDHGFSEIISKSKLLELHERFFKLPFQATKCKLAGLGPFCQEAAVLKMFESMASGKIMLAELVQREEIPVVVLYDTSQDDDVNINAACMKALHDKSLESPLQVNSVYMNVSVTSVRSDGTFYCQLPSRGLAKLNEILEKTDSYFHTQVTSELLVSRPFCGKNCLARYKGKWSRVAITNLHGSRVLDILFVDLGVQASVEVFELREIPSSFLRDLLTIPPQAVKCCLADLAVNVGSWTPDAVQWLRDTVLHCTDCSIKVAQLDEGKSMVHVSLFTSNSFHDSGHSVNQQLIESDLWKHQADVYLSSGHSPSKNSASTLSAPTQSQNITGSPARNGGRISQAKRSNLHPGTKGPQPDTPKAIFQVPPLLELPPAGHNMDIYVSLACHPGHFVIQPWQDMYKLVVLMGEMILYYNKTEEKPITVEKNQVYAAKVENNWHRVLVKGILTNGFVSIYELDYGRHELVSSTRLRPLIQEFRQLPFQGITAQLAGVKPRQWTEEASIVFRNHVEKKPLVAQLESVQEAFHPWDRKVTVYLVDTSQEEKDIWVHDLMAEFAEELTKSA